MSAEERIDAGALDVSVDLVDLPAIKPPGQWRGDFEGLLHEPLLLHEDLKDGCGGQTWPAGLALANYLLHEPVFDTLSGKKILELGAGGGLVGLALAKALAAKPQGLTYPISHGSQINVTDQMPMLALMEENIKLNQLPDTLVKASVLDWGSDLSRVELPDIVLAADCVYFEPAFPLLLKTLSDLIGPETVCYFCYKKRRKADARFFKAAKKFFWIHNINDDPLHETWSRDGITLYKITRKK